MSLRMPSRWVAATVIACLLLIQCACNQQPGHARDSAAQSSSAAHDLRGDEENGGHTLARHVGKSDDDLRERLARERHISAASTYTDRATAESAVAEAIAGNERRIRQWASGAGGHPNLVLDYDGQQPVGRTLHRGAAKSQPCSHAVVVLKWISAENYFVLTSYPECR